ncbi:MAG: hypothetical protein MMC23_002050 [Stictis urceolatum]|nr:hypothetical protein [Stictis urceolata]
MTATPPYHVLIVGGGICGFGTAISIALKGHKVSIFERAPQPHSIGAGIQITPNGVRILRELGVANDLIAKTTIPETLSILRYDGQKILAYRDSYDEELQQRYREPIWCLHRVDLLKALVARAKELGVQLRFNQRVCGVYFERPAIVFEDGQVEEGHLVVAADGLWSSMRSFFQGTPVSPQPTGDIAYRIILSANNVPADEELQSIIRQPGIRIWMGPGSHAVSYSLLGGSMINIVLLAPDDVPDNPDRTEGNVAEMLRRFEGWDPLLARFLSHVKEVDRWRLMQLHLEDCWVSDEGTSVMAGDSCHPMLPYTAQGASL